MISRLVLVGGLCDLLMGCASCHREGCEALEQRVDDATGMTRLAGFVASESDLVTNGCQECGFASATISTWSRQGDEATAAVVQEQTGSPALASTTSGSDGKYAQILESGDYWLCTGLYCFPASASEGKSTTLNIKLINGIPTGYLALPGAQGIAHLTGIERPPT